MGSHRVCTKYIRCTTLAHNAMCKKIIIFYRANSHRDISFRLLISVCSFNTLLFYYLLYGYRKRLPRRKKNLIIQSKGKCKKQYIDIGKHNPVLPRNQEIFGDQESFLYFCHLTIEWMKWTFISAFGRLWTSHSKVLNIPLTVRDNDGEGVSI